MLKVQQLTKTCFLQTYKRRATAKELFKIVSGFMKEKSKIGQTMLEYAGMQLDH
jgi:hypothetical protein